MDNIAQSLELKPAADKNQSLVLTPLEDLKGFLFHHLGRLFLFLITCSSVLLVLLIFFFVIREAIPFLTKFSITKFLTTKS